MVKRGVAENFGGEDYRLLEDRLLYQGFGRLRALRLRHRLFAGGWSGELQRELFATEDSCAVLPYDPQADAVVLVEQFRPGALERGLSPWTLEVPAGIAAPGEAPEQTVQRELQEETGCVPQALEYIARCFPSPGACGERLSLYCARVHAGEVQPRGGAAQEGEDIRTHVLPRGELQAQLQRRPTSAATLAALHWLLLHHERLRRDWR